MSLWGRGRGAGRKFSLASNLPLLDEKVLISALNFSVKFVTVNFFKKEVEKNHTVQYSIVSKR